MPSQAGVPAWSVLSGRSATASAPTADPIAIRRSKPYRRAARRARRMGRTYSGSGRLRGKRGLAIRRVRVHRRHDARRGVGEALEVAELVLDDEAELVGRPVGDAAIEPDDAAGVAQARDPHRRQALAGLAARSG